MGGCLYIYIYIYILAWKPAFGGLLCYGGPSTVFRRKRSDASVLSKATSVSYVDDRELGN